MTTPPVPSDTAYDALERRLAELRGGDHFRNYRRARAAVLAALAEADPSAEPSAYWQEELGGFDYMLNASPLIVEKLREHCHHITGISSYRYRGHHAHEAVDFRRKLEVLRKNDRSDLFVGEAPLLGGFGHPIDGSLVNIDTLKFYECLIALDRAGYLENLKADRNHREVWIEIGAGWGGFGHAMKTLFPGITYVIVDLPQTLLFSATYLLSAFPDARVALYPEVTAEEIAAAPGAYDFVFLPHTRFEALRGGIDVALNMVSFQEMTSGQVASYLARLKAIGTPRLYSFNRDESSNNREISKVSELIAANYAPPQVVKILDYAYQTLVPPKAPPPKKPPGTIDRLLGRKPPPPKVSVAVGREYRHVFAAL